MSFDLRDPNFATDYPKTTLAFIIIPFMIGALSIESCLNKAESQELQEIDYRIEQTQERAYQ